MTTDADNLSNLPIDKRSDVSFLKKRPNSESRHNPSFRIKNPAKRAELDVDNV